MPPMAVVRPKRTSRRCHEIFLDAKVTPRKGPAAMAEDCTVFKKISGTFFRSILADRVHQVLDPPGPASAGRYHRLGEPTLYTSAALEWSIQAIAGYMREDGLRRVVVPLKVGDAMVLDQHDEEACKRLGIDRELSNESWRTALSEGREPASWRNVDIARHAGADGIIDRSRMIPGGWHLNLFRWNERGGPSVEVCGDPVEIALTADGPTWGL
ncbi:RES domain-containing protein [Rhizobium miluonense]|uniref:RES domain-containing protein n=2 Tax=Rhizobium miluonense TaxID=411945 RepID=A0ABU1SQD4_9HYPH|nr:RES domain-containing protein [Rhizobium miluonense]